MLLLLLLLDYYTFRDTYYLYLTITIFLLLAIPLMITNKGNLQLLRDIERERERDYFIHSFSSIYFHVSTPALCNNCIRLIDFHLPIDCLLVSPPQSPIVKNVPKWSSLL